MPVYSYRCRKCGRSFDLLIGVTADSREPKCAECGSTDLKKLLTTFSVRNASPSKEECSAGSCSTGKCPTCF